MLLVYLVFFLTIVLISLLIYLYVIHKKRRGEMDPRDVNWLSGDMAEQVIHSVPDMIFIVDRECHIRRILNYDANKLSVPLEAIIGLRIQDLLDKEFVPAIEFAIEEAFQTGTLQVAEYAITFDGGTNHFEGRFNRVNDMFVSCFERNITQRKAHDQRLAEAKSHLEHSQKMNKIILDNAISGLLFLNPDFTVEWENLSGVSFHPLASKYKPNTCCFKEVMGIDAPCEFCVAKKALETGQVEHTEMVIDENLIVKIWATPVFNDDGSNAGVVMKFDDVTLEQKAAAQLQRAKDAAEASDKLKSMFISNMSHEIRTPLNSIVGFSDLLAHTNDQVEKDDYNALIQRNNELLLQLINDILDLSKIESNTLEFIYSDVDINKTLENIVLSTRLKVSDITDVQILFTPAQETCVIHSESNRLQQVLLNFMNNALKFTQEGSIRIGYEVRETEMYFFVTDTGKGIPENMLGEIFKRFVKLDNFVNGTGLGLSICQTIINRLGGEIGAFSELGKGSTFWFTLPVKPL